MSASDHAEVEALLIRMGEMRRTLHEMARRRGENENEGAQATEDLLRAEQILSQAEKLLRRFRETIA